MIEVLVVGLVMLAAVVIVPLIALKVLLEVGVGIVLLPFRLVGGLFKVLLGGAGLLVKLVWGIVAAVATVIAVVLAVVALPLLPLLLIGGLMWLVLRRPRDRAIVLN